jgi:hypothetical protein
MPVRIRNGVSQPADGDSPSFLTTLPAELRNQVYRWLFVREEPIVYDNCHSHDAREPSFDSDEYCGENFIDYEDPLSQDELDILQKPSHDMRSCVPLLRSCRQIYFEAVGLLYSANSFIISVNPYQHNPQMTQISTAAIFLTSLRSQLDLLKDLVIDVTPLCPSVGDCAGEFDLITDRDFVEEIDVLPLVRILWSQPKVTRIITLASTGRILDRRFRPFVHRGVPGYKIKPHLLEGIIRALGCDTALGIMDCGRFERLLSSVWIDRDLAWGWVVHPIPSQESEVVRTFDIIPSSQIGSVTLSWRHQVFDSKLHMLPHSIKDWVESYAIESGEDILFDLDRQTSHGLDFGILHLNRRFRRSMQNGAANGSEITVSFATSEVRTDFSNYASLRRWLEHPVSQVYPTIFSYEASLKIPPTIALDFDTADGIGLADLRINIVSFIRLTYTLLAQSKIVVRMKTNAGVTTDEYATSLETLRKRCFVFGSEMMKNFPAQAYRPCPALWIDGYGTVLGAGEYPNDSSQHTGLTLNPHAQLSDKEVSNIGHDYAISMGKRPASMESSAKYRWPRYGDNNATPIIPYATRIQYLRRGRWVHQTLRSCDSMISMWMSLKDLDWTEEWDGDAWDDL